MGVAIDQQRNDTIHKSQYGAEPNVVGDSNRWDRQHIDMESHRDRCGRTDSQYNHYCGPEMVDSLTKGAGSMGAIFAVLLAMIFFTASWFINLRATKERLRNGEDL